MVPNIPSGLNIISTISIIAYTKYLYSDISLNPSFNNVKNIPDNIEPVILPKPPKTTITNISIENINQTYQVLIYLNYVPIVIHQHQQKADIAKPYIFTLLILIPIFSAAISFSLIDNIAFPIPRSHNH